ncbi:MFS transporter [Streptomyces sp. NPDC079020]|uniref:MFS transporter n=1 Tax=Streptomyces sp. NPDC079020 TaxID=3365722 RepID=UPI0037D1D801
MRQRLRQPESALQPAGTLVAQAVVGAAFLRRQRVSRNPMIDLGLFRTRRFNVPLFIDALATFALVGFNLFSWQFMQLVLGLDPFEAALWSLPTFLVMPLGITLATVLAPRVGKPNVIAAGLLVATLGFVVLALIRGDSGVVHLAAGLTVASLGIAAVSAVVTEVILSAAPPERAGAASALAETSAEFGGALGIAVLGSIGTVVYRAQMAADAPATLTSGQLEAASDTLGGALGTAAKLPPETAEAARDAAFDAFARETRIAAVASAVLMAGGALLITTLLRSTRTPSAVPSGAHEAAPQGSEGRGSDDQQSSGITPAPS